MQIELLKGFNHHSNNLFKNTPRVFFPQLQVESYFQKCFFFARLDNKKRGVLILACSLYSLQVRGRGGGRGVHLCSGSVPAQSIQRAQHLQQSDDPVLQALDQGEVSLHAGLASLHLTLLLRHAGR